MCIMVVKLRGGVLIRLSPLQLGIIAPKFSVSMPGLVSGQLPLCGLWVPFSSESGSLQPSHIIIVHTP